MDVEQRISHRLKRLIALVQSGDRERQWSPSITRRIGTFPIMRSWLSGEIMAIVKFSPPTKSLIVEHFGQSPSKAWADMEKAGQPRQVPLLHEAIEWEYDFYRSSRPPTDGPLAEARRFAGAALTDGFAIPLATFSAHADARYQQKHAAWLDRLNAANLHKHRGPVSKDVRRAQRVGALRERYGMGSLGFQLRGGVVRPRLDLLASRLDHLLTPLYSLPEDHSEGHDPLHYKWTDIAELIQLIRDGRPSFRSAQREFPELTGHHVRLAVRASAGPQRSGK